MSADEQTIRDWFDRWLQATKTGDLALAKSLVADGAVFLVPGAGAMDKDSFCAAATADDPNTEFALDCAIEAISVLGDHAWLQSRLGLSMTDKASGATTKMAGHALSVLERSGDSWVVIREANTMVPVPG